ncbi:MAG: serine hydrolase domain-containing protein [SAR324 cluster bacterium]
MKLRKLSRSVQIATFLVMAVVCCTVAWGQGLPRANPEEVGLSASRLERITEAFQAEVAKGRIPGAVVLVARYGKIAYFQSFGKRDPASGADMANDDIFRIYSMSKPFTAVAVMTLVEDGKLLLSDHVSQYLPELAKREVAISDGQGGFKLVPAVREITVHDLLTHTGGLTYGTFTTTPAKKVWMDAEKEFWKGTLAQMVERMAKLPLVVQPGSQFEYSWSYAVLGRIVEVVSGKSLGAYVEERIARPLGLRDTGFYVHQENLGRLAQSAPDPATGKPQILIDVTKQPQFEGGGESMVSTAADYAVFCQMLLNGGKYNNVRLLGPKTVEWMTSDHLGPLIGLGAYSPGAGYGYGLGFAVRVTPGMSVVPGSTGEFYWNGAGGTSFWVDPKEKLIAVYMMQSPVVRFRTRYLIKDLVTQAIEKPEM